MDEIKLAEAIVAAQERERRRRTRRYLIVAGIAALLTGGALVIRAIRAANADAEERARADAFVQDTIAELRKAQEANRQRAKPTAH